MKNELFSIDSYLKEIEYWLPYPSVKRGEVLERLRVEIIEAMQDTKKDDPIQAFGDPYLVAKDVSSGYDWDSERSGYFNRFMALMIDSAIQTFAIMAGFYVWIRYIPFPENVVTEISFNQALFALITLFSLLIPYVLFCNLGYYIIFEKVTSKTPGKALLGLTVCDISGVRITWTQAIIRNLTKIDTFILLIEALIGIYQKTSYQRPLDIVANTIVIRKRSQKNPVE